MTPKKHGLDIIVAVGKRPGGPPSFPFSAPKRGASAGASRAAGADPDNDGDNDVPGGADPDQDAGKDSREEAGYLPCEWCCGSCVNFHPDTGYCEEVQGQFRGTDKCLKYFTPLNPKYLSVRPTPPDQASLGGLQGPSADMGDNGPAPDNGGGY